MFMLPRYLLLSFLSCGLLVGCQSETPTTTEATAPAELPLDTLPAATPRLTPDSLTWHRVERPTSADAPLIRPGVGRRAVAPRDTVAPPPAEARLYDLTLKASEYHKIDPTQLAEVRGREGTVVRIPAGTLVDARGEPATGAVFLELKECYGLADVLLSNIISETTDDQLLMPSGVVLVRATSGGQPLRVADGRAVQVELPGPVRPDMRLYYGRGERRQPIRWIATGPETAAADEQIYSDAQPMPTYGSGPTSLSALVRYPTAALESRTQGTVYVSAVIDEAGRVLSPKLLRGLGNGLDAEALRVLQQSSGRWTPGQREGRFVRVKMLIPVRFNLPNTPDLVARADSTGEPLEPAASVIEVPPAERQAFRVGQLGWLAAARPRLAAEAVTTLVAAVEPDTHTSVRLVLHDGNTIILGQPTETGYNFVDVPANKKAVLLGIRYMSGTPYVAVREITTGRHSSEQLSFRETTLAALEQLIE